MVIEHHPDLEAEQGYILFAYDRLRAMRARVAGMRNPSYEQLERLAWERWRELRLRALADDRSALVFGRIDRADAERFYIGRRHVEGPESEVVVVDWRARVSTAFYRASAADAMGLARRRHFLVEGAQLLGLADETFERGTVAGSDDALELLRAALERRRGGEMRDIVATIQAEQDLVIRSPLEGVVVVQGGPGTGKTAVGLHRAAYLVYEHRDVLERAGVLVVGPNRIFIRYVSQVLPSLGESAVDQRPIEGLGPPLRTEPVIDPEAERLKGDPRMAAVLRRAIWSQVRAPETDAASALNAIRMRVPAADLERFVAMERDERVPYHRARERFLRHVYRELYRQYQGPVPSVLSMEQFTAAVRKDRELARTLDRVWPRVSPQTAVAGVLRGPVKQRAAAEGILTDDEQRALRRGSKPRRWTRADLALLDEARVLCDGVPETFGHVIVDEAQDLSPMELRMIGRRCPTGSMTILGDLAQATGVWAHAAWETVLAHLPSHAGTHVEELTLGYRVAERIMDVAARLLAEVAPDLRAPVAVRHGGSVSFVRTDRLADEAAAAAGALAASEGAYAVIAPDALLAPVADALARAGVRFGDARREALAEPVTLLAAQDCKGLEFDGVVLVEPAAVIEEEGDAGLRRLFICVTRAMRDLVVVHTGDLPAALAPRAEAVA